MKNKDSDILFLNSLIEAINEDLKERQLYNLEYVILRFSNFLSKDLSISKEDLSDKVICYIHNFLLENSNNYRNIYSNHGTFLIFYKFLKFMLEKYDSMLFKEKEVFDINVYKASGDNKSYNREVEKVSILDVNSPEYTINLLNEAVRLYFELYDKRTLIATFSNDEEMRFRFEEANLAHVLGVELKVIVKQEKLVDLFKITESEKNAILNNDLGSAAIDILLRIVDISSGNLLTYEEDRLRRIKLDRLEKIFNDYGNLNYTLSKYQSEGNPPALKYGKVNMRSKMFINYKPFDEVSLSIKFPNKYRLFYLGDDDVNHSVLITKNDLSPLFKYSSFITDFSRKDSRRYFKSLEAKKVDDISTWKKDGELAISTKVVSDPDPGSSGGRIEIVFSEEKQKQFIEEFIDEFSNTDSNDDLQELKEYLEYLNRQKKKK